MQVSFPRFYWQSLNLNSSLGMLRASLCLTSLSLAELQAHVKSYLHPEEYAYFKTLDFEKRQLSYLLGRYTAKQAIANYNENKISLSDILIKPGIFHYPVVYGVSTDCVQISYSHCNQCCIAVAYPQVFPMSIDIESINVEHNSVIESQLTTNEKFLMQSLQESSQDLLFSLFWSVKEALSKVLRTGLTTPLEIYAISQIKKENNYWISEFKNFQQYEALSFLIGQYTCSIVFPKHSKILIDIPTIQSWLNE